MRENENNPDLDVDAVMTEIRRAAAGGLGSTSPQRPMPGVQFPSGDAQSAQLQLNGSLALALEEVSRAIKGLESRQEALEHRVALQADRHTIAALNHEPRPVPSPATAEPAAPPNIARRTGQLVEVSREQLKMLAEGLAETATRFSTVEGGLTNLRSAVQEVSRRLADPETDVPQAVPEAKETPQQNPPDDHGRAVQELGERLAALDRTLAETILELRDRLSILQAGLAENENRIAAIESKLADEHRNRSLPGFDYYTFESRFRGSSEEVKRKQSPYLDLFLGRKNVVDLGCGRGEFLELMREKQIPATGVDSNADMIEHCRLQRLTVVHNDLTAYLHAQPDESIDGVFVSQVVEHLSPGAVMELIDLCGRKLVHGGVIVAETINPACPEAMVNFYMDPTHVRPIPPGLLRFMFEQGPFKVESVIFSAPANPQTNAPQLVASGVLPAQAGAYLDYAVYSVKR